jgi:4-hydroxy-tetrahydrodipicolinate reductase
MTALRVCVAGVTGWTGSAVARAILQSEAFALTGAVARRAAGMDAGEAAGMPRAGVPVAATLGEALVAPVDVLIDFTHPESVKARTMEALDRDLRVVIGTSGLSGADFDEIADAATARGLGVIAAGNFSITAALAKHVALLAARYLPAREIVDYASADKPDAPSGTARELAEALAEIRSNHIRYPVAKTIGEVAARGADVAGTQVHSVRLPGYTLGFETLFGLPDERLTIRHDAGPGAGPYVAGALLAAERVMEVSGLVRGLDALLFGD